MYKTSMSIRMLFMTSVIACGLLAFSVIIVSQSLDIYTQNQVLRTRLSQKEALLKQFGERAEALNQYRLLEKELKKLVDHSSMPVVYAKNSETNPPVVKTSSTGDSQGAQPSQLQSIDLATDQADTSQWEQEPDVPVGLPEENPEPPQNNHKVPEGTVDPAVVETPQSAAQPAPQPGTSATKSTAENEPVKVDESKDKPSAVQPAENKPAPRPEINVAETPTGPLVDVENLFLTVESNNTVNFRYKLSNIHPDNKTVAGYIFIILANPYINPPLFAPFPAVPLVGGFPADYRKGTQFSIKRGKTVRGKLPGLIDPGHYNQAWIFAYSKDGELILKKHLISNNG